MKCGKNTMSRFHRKPKPETMKKNREVYADVFIIEIQWLKDNLSILTNHNKFLVDMYSILVTGSRKVTPKMALTIKNSIEKCKNSPLYNEELREEADKKLKPILDKIKMVKSLAEHKGDYGLDFIDNVENYVKNNHKITKKQMTALNKVYKRCSEDLFKGEE